MSDPNSSIIAKLKEEMLSSPVDDVTIITRPQLEILEAAISSLTRELAEAREAMDEALPLLNHLSRETATDHIGDEWLTPTAQRARNVAARLRTMKEKP